jgi:hypothetical protein
MGGTFYSPTLHTYSSRQWRRISAYETYSSYSSPGLAVPMTARFPREMEWAINNAKAFVMPPRRQMMFFPPLTTAAGTITEQVMHVFVPMEFADGYQKIYWNIGHSLSYSGDPVGTEAVTWRLYCSWSLYRGPDAFDASYLSPWYGSDSIVVSSADYDDDGSGELQVVRDADSLVWLVLTAQSNSTITTGSCSQLSLVGRCA